MTAYLNKYLFNKSIEAAKKVQKMNIPSLLDQKYREASDEDQKKVDEIKKKL